MKLRISRQLHAAIKERAELLGCSQQSVVRRCLRYAEGVAFKRKPEPATRAGVVFTFDDDGLSFAPAPQDVRDMVAWALEQTAQPPPVLCLDPADLAQNPVILNAEQMEG